MEIFKANQSILSEPFSDVKDDLSLDRILPDRAGLSEPVSSGSPSLIPDTGDNLWARSLTPENMFDGHIQESISPVHSEGNIGSPEDILLGTVGDYADPTASEDVRPLTLLFSTDQFYNPGETVRFRGQVYAGNSNLTQVDFWLQKDGGEWVDISDAIALEPDGDRPGYFFFRYELTDLEPDRYQLRAQAIDGGGNAGETVTQSFTVLDLPPGQALPHVVKQAIARAADLENYSPAELAATRRWLVSLADGQSSSELAPLLGAVDLGATGHIPGTYIWEFPEDVNPMDVGLASLVQFSYPLVEVQLRSQFLPDDEFFGQQWHLLNTGQTGNLSGVDANVTTAWDSVTGAGVVIGIVDDGLQHTHPDLQPNYLPDLSRDLNEGDPENRIYDRDPAPLSRVTFEADIDSPEPIFDGDLSFFFLDVSQKGTVDNLTLTWDIDHPDKSELSAFLNGPTDTQLELDDVSASGSIATNFFNGIKAEGNWTLVFDDPIFGNGGFLNNWSLTVETSDAHGTAVAGVAAAKGNNGEGISGVAPDAGLAGLRLTADSVAPIQIADALYSDLNQSIHIFNNSWKPPALWNDQGLAMMALHQGIGNGRGGLGNIYVFGAGNDWLEGAKYRENLNYNPLASSRYTIAVGAIEHTGKKASYSQEGAPLLVSAPSGGVGSNSIGISTTDLLGNKGRNADGNGQYGPNLDRLDYTNDFDGTSAATPVVSGVAALMLEANPSLTWRDVQHILVQTANRDLIDDRKANWSGESGDVLRHSDKYGFGVVDATAAVNAAASWTPVAPEVSISTGNMSANNNFPKRIPFRFTEEVDIDEDITVEWVEVVFDGKHELWGDLEIVLTAPDGTQSVLANSLDASESFIERRLFDDGNDRHTWVLSSARHWGTSSQGEWKLGVRDKYPGKKGTWHSWQLNIYGTKPTVSVEATAPDASEDGNSGEFTFTRTGNTDNPLIVNYSSSGTATAGEDYEALTETVEIPAGEDSVTVAIEPIDDDEVEGDETVFFVIDADDAYDIGTNNSATVTIADNDFANNPPTLTGIELLTGAKEGTSFTISYGDLMANATDADGDPIALQISTIASGTLMKNDVPVEPGVTTLSSDEVVVWIPDTVGDEVAAFAVRAFDGTDYSAQVQVNVAVAALPVVTISATDANASESGDAGEFAVTRSGDTTSSLSVSFSIAGNASAGSDYSEIGPIVIPAGSSEVKVSLDPIDDEEIEGSETVVLNLEASTGYLLGDESSASVSIADNDSENHAPTMTNISIPTCIASDESLTISYADLLDASDATDVDGDAISFAIEEVGSEGTLTFNEQPVIPGETVLSEGSNLIWTPNTAGDSVPAFTVRAIDGKEVSSSVEVTIHVLEKQVIDEDKIFSDVFEIRFTDIKAVEDDPEGDKFQFQFEVLNWTNQPAEGLRIALNVGNNSSVQDAAPMFVDAQIDKNGTPLGDDADPLPGNQFFVNAGTVQESTSTAIQWNTRQFDLSTFQSGPIPNKTPVISNAETIDDGNNVLDGFVFTVDDFDELEALSFNWNLLDENDDPIGTFGSEKSYGFGTVIMTRSECQHSPTFELSNANSSQSERVQNRFFTKEYRVKEG